MPLTPAEMIAAVNDALGVDGFAPSETGGQKLVGSATLSGLPVMVKFVMLPSPDPEPVLERAMREVEILAGATRPFAAHPGDADFLRREIKSC